MCFRRCPQGMCLIFLGAGVLLGGLLSAGWLLWLVAILLIAVGLLLCARC